MVCEICHGVIINGGFGNNWEHPAGFLLGRYGIEAHASCALTLFNKGKFKNVQVFVEHEFWTYFL